MALPANVKVTEKVLTTTNGLHLPLRDGSTIMYIRDSYEDLYSLAIQKWEVFHGIFLSGSPGVGKSFFLNYLLVRLLGNQKKVLFVNMADGVAKLYRNFNSNPKELFYANNWPAFRAEASASDFVLIDPPQDSAKSQEVTLNHLKGKKFLVALSPDPENCKELTKTAESQTWLYLGPLHHDEACDMRSKCYSSVHESTFEKRFSCAGGIPRVLYQVQALATVDSALQKLVEKQDGAIADALDKPRRIDAGTVPSQFKHLWALYHLVPTSTYDAYTIEVCGDGPLATLKQRLLDFEVRELWDLYAQTSSRLITLRGIRYEAYAHKRILIHGVQGTARKLGIAGLLSENVDGNLLPLAIPAHCNRLYLQDNDVTQKLAAAIKGVSSNGAYLIPRLPNFPVLDSIYVPASSSSSLIVGFRMKAGNSKALSDGKVQAIVSNASQHMVVVVPNEHILTKRLPGPDILNQYLLILNEDNGDVNEDPMEEG